MKSLITVWALLFTSGLYAADLTEQLQQCRSIDVALQRLACYDKIDTLKSTVAAAPQATVAEATPTPVADFGLERKKVEQQIKAVDNLSLKLKSAKTNKLGLLVFTFTNGQVWRQTNKEYFAVKGDGAFQIERGILGAFYLSKVGTNRKIRVMREQ
jgi:hypothetical protein